MKSEPSLFDPYPLDPLNARELEILGLMSAGLSNAEIARKLSLSLETIKWYNKHIFSKLAVNSRTRAVAKAVQTGLLENLFQAGKAAAPAAEQPRPRHNLPAPVTSFVGRQKEIADVERLLQDNRLLVLTGAGGSGKTRLALEVARRSLERYPDGVWLVELAPLVDPSLVPQAVAEVCGLTSSAKDTLDAVLKRFLARKQLLLFLDNFEHLLEAAPLVSEILAAAPGVTVLVTSRERLHLYGEYEFPVYPLSLPDLDLREPVERILAYDAVRLFIQRAQAVRSGLSLNEAEAAAAAQICCRLDGLPLALELAASQAKMYTLPQLAERLKEGLVALPAGPLDLPAGPLDLPARQRTLRATIEWSYSLLSPQEKLLFARLAVFQGGGTLDAIVEICRDAQLENVPACLASLVDKNLTVPREGQDGELYFTMLETIRAYALERLKESADDNEQRHRYAAYFTSLAERADLEIRGERQAYWFARLQVERENLYAVLHETLDGGEVELGLRLVGALAYYWYYDGYFIEETRHWAEQARQKSVTAPPALAAGVLIAAGRLAVAYGDPAGGKDILHQAYDIYRRTGDERQAAWALVYLSSCYFNSEEDVLAGRELCQQSLVYFRGVGDGLGIAQALNILGEMSRKLGDYAAARNYYEECLEITQGTGDRLRYAWNHGNLAIVAYRQNRPADAERLTKKGIQLLQEIGNRFGLLAIIHGLAGAEVLTGRPERAARLMGAANALLEEMGARYQPFDEMEVDHILAAIRHQLSATAFEAAWSEGAALTYPQAIVYALETP